MPQNNNPKIKKIGLAIVIVLILVLVYIFMSGGSSSSSGSLLTSTPYGAVGSAELALLNQMRSLKIDTSLFNDPAYKSLIDYSVDITPENVGRPNPFAPLSGISDPNASQQRK